jgi:hypothetical protein
LSILSITSPNEQGKIPTDDQIQNSEDFDQRHSGRESISTTNLAWAMRSSEAGILMGPGAMPAPSFRKGPVGDAALLGGEDLDGVDVGVAVGFRGVDFDGGGLAGFEAIGA